jgi:hypothetical protein
MRIIKHINPNFPERETYKCTIRYTTKFGLLDEVKAWRDDQLKNEAYYLSLEESNSRGAAAYYASKSRFDNYTGD